MQIFPKEHRPRTLIHPVFIIIHTYPKSCVPRDFYRRNVSFKLNIPRVLWTCSDRISVGKQFRIRKLQHCAFRLLSYALHTHVYIYTFYFRHTYIQTVLILQCRRKIQSRDAESRNACAKVKTRKGLRGSGHERAHEDESPLRFYSRRIP